MKLLPLLLCVPWLSLILDISIALLRGPFVEPFICHNGDHLKYYWFGFHFLALLGIVIYLMI